MKCQTHPEVALICPACQGAKGGKTPSAARLRALAKNRKKRWPTRKAKG